LGVGAGKGWKRREEGKERGKGWEKGKEGGGKVPPQ